MLFILVLGRVAMADTTPGPAALGKPTGTIDTWTFSAGKADGYEVGDRVRFLRGEKVLGEGMVVTVGPATSTALLVGKSSGTPKAGDRVEFLRHRKPLPAYNPTTSPGASAAGAPGGFSSTDWSDVGKIEGMLGDDWMTRNTRTCTVYARKADLKYVKEVVDGLDASAEYNASLMGLSAPTPMTFYFCSLENPAHTHPKFANRLRARTRFAGIALSGLNTTLVNLGDWRSQRHYQPWSVEETCRHEMNHLFAFQVLGTDREKIWGWLYEALAHYAEESIKPAASRLDLAAVKSYMKGYSAKDASFVVLVNERNSDEQEQYRDYDKLLTSIVFFIREKYGSDAVSRLMRGARGKDAADAMQDAFGKSSAGVEADWKAFYGIQ
ncbi:MAG: hypothetical protein FJX76_15255 [Armatimonadetes bacterium]|nr:hypothetical protein [Armatimonadota bacterium]